MSVCWEEILIKVPPFSCRFCDESSTQTLNELLKEHAAVAVVKRGVIFSLFPLPTQKRCGKHLY